MSEEKTVIGSCLCKSVNITINNMNNDVGICHCSMCQKWVGGPFVGIDYGTKVTIGNPENVSVYNSSDWAERGFCKTCGSHLFYRLKAQASYFIPVGLFDNKEDFSLHHQIFIDEKPSFYSFSGETKNMTGAEVFALYSQKES